MRIFLNDIGIVNALGNGKASVLEGLLAGRTTGMVRYDALLTGRKTRVGAVDCDMRSFDGELSEFDCRNNRLLATVLDQIAPGLDTLRAHVRSERIAVILGTSTSGIAEGEAAVRALEATGSLPGEFNYRQQEIGTSAQFAARYLDLAGPRYTVSTACSSSAKVFAAARRLLSSGRCDAAVVGGCDTLCQLTLDGFDSLESLSPGICNPFSANRDGINIGEGACVFLLSKQASAIELLGVGESSDGWHISAPDPTGQGAELAVSGALREANLKPTDVGYINLHGTATRKNDEMESAVTNRIFGADVPCSSTKSQTGHLLGAAGATEVGLCWLLLGRSSHLRRLPRHIWDGVADSSLLPIALVEEGETWSRSVFMSNSFAFGGSNAAVVIGTR